MTSFSQKCPGCGGKYRVIDPKCKECVKRYHKYRYETPQGLREQYEEGVIKDGNS